MHLLNQNYKTIIVSNLQFAKGNHSTCTKYIYLQDACNKVITTKEKNHDFESNCCNCIKMLNQLYDLSFTLQSYISFLNYFSFALNLSF